MSNNERPLLQGDGDKELILRNIAKFRNPIYEKLSDLIIDEKNNPNQVVESILNKIEIIK